MKHNNRNGAVIHNLGLLDRTVRALAGTAMVLYAVNDLVNHSVMFQTWHALTMLFAIYPLMTALLGWDGIYALLNARSCGADLPNDGDESLFAKTHCQE